MLSGSKAVVLFLRWKGVTRNVWSRPVRTDYFSVILKYASHVVDFNARNKSLTAKLLQQGYRYNKLRKTFSKFYRRHYELVSKFNVGLKTLLHQGLSEPEFYGDLVYTFKKIVGRVDGPDIKLFILVGLGRSFFVCCLTHRGSTVGFLLLQCSSGVVRHPRDLQVSVATHFCRVLIFASS